MKINIEIIPHHDQRYATAGDYWVDAEGVQQVRVSALGNPLMEMAVVLHELVELALCEARGIAEPDIMAFDVAHPDLDDPGASHDAPYHREHMFAEKLERQFIDEAGIEWRDYDHAVTALFV